MILVSLKRRTHMMSEEIQGGLEEKKARMRSFLADTRVLNCCLIFISSLLTPEYSNRIELLQDFEFPEASNRIKVTKDGKYCMATGTYKPQIHVYEFSQSSLKFDRHTDCENVDFVLISDDWTKSVHLQSDRSLEFHSQGGIHARSRIPRFGRSICYNPQNCDIMVGASGNEIYRLNIDQGRFLAPFETESDGVNVLDMSLAHGLTAAGLEDGTVEFWDSRSRRRVANLIVGGGGHGSGSGTTAISFHRDGLNVAVGTHEGKTLLFDLRANQPTLVKDQGYGYPIKKIHWIDTPSNTSSSKVLTADKRIVKIWDRNDGTPFTSIEPTVDINDVAHIEGSGLFFLANEGIAMHTYFVPSIGPAPSWCSFLENVTEEMEENLTSTVYDNYKFVTRQELDSLNLGHLLGSNVVKSYMHGYFIDARLYQDAKLISNPFTYQEQREREIKKRIEKERDSRIRTSGAISAKVKVNKGLAEKIASNKIDKNDLVDERFKNVFEDPDFEVDENSNEFMLLNPTKPNKYTVTDSQGEYKNRGLTAVEIEEEERVAKGQQDSDEDSDDSDGSDSEDSEDAVKAKVSESAKAKAPRKVKGSKSTIDPSGMIEKYSPSMIISAKSNKDSSSTFEDQIDDVNAVEQERHAIKSKIKRGTNGETELTFVPSKSKAFKKSRKPQEQEEEQDGEIKQRNTGREKQRFDGRRRASKNAFRGL